MGTVKTMANRKLEVIKNRLQREIERLGIDISVHRQEYVSDGSNGYIPSGEQVFAVRGILKSLSNASQKMFAYTDGGKNCTITDTLSVLCSPIEIIVPDDDGFRFEFPKMQESKVIEAEFCILDSSNAIEGLEIRFEDRVVGGIPITTEINWFTYGNKFYLDYNAETTGIYTVRVLYRSGRVQGQHRPNVLMWSEKQNKVTSGLLEMFGGNNEDTSANEYRVAEFDIEVMEIGKGTLIFETDEREGPVIDKFEFIGKELDDISVIETTDVTIGNTFQMYDWFINGNTKYTIMQVSNVGKQNVYWLLGLTTEPIEVPRYGE